MLSDSLKSAPFAAIVLDRAFAVRDYNEKAAQLIGKDCALGADLERFCQFEILSRSIKEWFSTGQRTLSTEIPLSDGRYLDLECWLSEEDASINVLIRDISETIQERKKSELLGLAVGKAWESVCITDADLDPPGPRFVYCNKGYEKLTGFSPEEVLGKSPRIHQGPLTDKSVLSRLKQNLKDGFPFHGETLNYRKDGSPFWLEWKIFPIKNEVGKITNYIAFQRDISDRKNAQQKATELSSIISHELRAPLASIQGSLRLLQLDYDPVLAPELLDICVKSVQRLLRLVNEIIEVEEAENGQMELDLKALPVRQLFHSTQQTLQNYLPEKDLRINIDVPIELEVIADEDRIIQVLINLVSNAMKHSPRKGEVTLSACQDADGSIRILVKDQGPGISQENIEKLFSKFHMLHAEDGIEREGSGLGLAIAKSLVQAHGGTVGVESKVGEGSTFWFNLKGKHKDERISPQKQLSGSILLVAKNDAFAEYFRTGMNNLGYLVNRVVTLEEIDSALNQFLPEICVLGIDSNREKSYSAGLSRLTNLKIPIVLVQNCGFDPEGLSTSLSASKVSPKQFLEQVQQYITAKTRLKEPEELVDRCNAT